MCNELILVYAYTIKSANIHCNEICKISFFAFQMFLKYILGKFENIAILLTELQC